MVDKKILYCHTKQFTAEKSNNWSDTNKTNKDSCGLAINWNTGNNTSFRTI